MRKLVLLLAVLALVAFGLVACGGDDDDTTTAGGETTATETTGGGGGGGSTVEVTASADQLAYDQSSLETGSGSVTIDFTNPSTTGHDVRIEDESGEDIGGTDVIADDSTTATVELEPGSYTFFCSVPGHREAGMEGSLTAD
jgi:plastocyanin